MKIDPGKCKVMKLERTLNRANGEYHIEGNKLQESSCVRGLEVILMLALSSEHVRRIVRQGNYFSQRQNCSQYMDGEMFRKI